MADDPNDNSLEIVAHIVGAYVSNNAVPLTDLSALIESMAATMAGLASGSSPAPQQNVRPVPAVPIKKSITPDYLISLEDGERFKTLKRTLAVRYGLTPDQYRAKWGLPHDYPMVAPNYSKRRSEVAKEIGLGQPSGVERKRS